MCGNVAYAIDAKDLRLSAPQSVPCCSDPVTGPIRSFRAMTCVDPLMAVSTAPPGGVSGDTEGEGIPGSAPGLAAALTVDWFKGGRTDAEEAVDQAVSEALSDVRDRRTKRERGSGALLWEMVLLAVACKRLRVPSLQRPRRMPLAPCRPPRGLCAATDGFHHGRGGLWRLWSGTRPAARLWHLVRRMPRRVWPVARERVVSELTPQRSDRCVGPPRPSRSTRRKIFD